jgi:hypothetical protein
MVDDSVWPVADGETVWLPPGTHAIEPGKDDGGLRLVRLNAELQGARQVNARSIEFSYRSGARAIAILDRRPLHVSIDGTEERAAMAGPNTILLPRGQHIVTITCE